MSAAIKGEVRTQLHSYSCTLCCKGALTGTKAKHCASRDMQIKTPSYMAHLIYDNSPLYSCKLYRYRHQKHQNCTISEMLPGHLLFGMNSRTSLIHISKQISFKKGNTSPESFCNANVATVRPPIRMKFIKQRLDRAAPFFPTKTETESGRKAPFRSLLAQKGQGGLRRASTPTPAGPQRSPRPPAGQTRRGRGRGRGRGGARGGRGAGARWAM